MEGLLFVSNICEKQSDKMHQNSAHWGQGVGDRENLCIAVSWELKHGGSARGNLFYGHSTFSAFSFISADSSQF